MLFYNQNRQKVDHGPCYVTSVWGDPKWLRGGGWISPPGTDHQISTTKMRSNTIILIENHWNNAVMMLNSQLSQNMHLGTSYVMLILGCPEMVEGGGLIQPPFWREFFKRVKNDPKVFQCGRNWSQTTRWCLRTRFNVKFISLAQKLRTWQVG